MERRGRRAKRERKFWDSSQDGEIEEGKEADKEESRKETDVENRKGRRKILVWNIAGARRQDMKTWEFIKDFDFVSLCET